MAIPLKMEQEKFQNSWSLHKGVLSDIRRKTHN